MWVGGRMQHIMSQVNVKNYRRIELEKHYVIVGEPAEFYLSYMTTKDEKEVALPKLSMQQLKIQN